MEINYVEVGDYLLPAIALTERKGEHPPLGRYGEMHKAYLRNHRPILYSQLLLSERLYPLCREIDEAARLRFESIADPEQAHEVILAELVYC